MYLEHIIIQCIITQWIEKHTYTLGFHTGLCVREGNN